MLGEDVRLSVKAVSRLEEQRKSTRHQHSAPRTGNRGVTLAWTGGIRAWIYNFFLQKPVIISTCNYKRASEIACVWNWCMCRTLEAYWHILHLDVTRRRIHTFPSVLLPTDVSVFDVTEHRKFWYASSAQEFYSRGSWFESPQVHWSKVFMGFHNRSRYV
jgi:hypothetical protein